MLASIAVIENSLRARWISLLLHSCRKESAPMCSRCEHTQVTDCDCAYEAWKTEGIRPRSFYALWPACPDCKRDDAEYEPFQCIHSRAQLMRVNVAPPSVQYTLQNTLHAKYLVARDAILSRCVATMESICDHNATSGACRFWINHCELKTSGDVGVEDVCSAFCRAHPDVSAVVKLNNREWQIFVDVTKKIN